MSGRASDKVPGVGDRVRLLHMEDPSGPEPGAEGTVVYIGEVLAVDVEGSPELKHLIGRRKYWVEWEGGGTMATIEGVDKLEVVPSVCRSSAQPDSPADSRAIACILRKGHRGGEKTLNRPKHSECGGKWK